MGFQIFLEVPVQNLVETPEPGQWRLVGGGEAVVEIHQGIVHGHVLLQGQDQISQETSIVKVLVGREFTGGHDNDLSSLIVIPTNLNNSMFSNVCKVSLCLLLSVNTWGHWRSNLTSNLDLSGQLKGEILVYGPIRHGRVDPSSVANNWSNGCGRNLFVKVIFLFGFSLKKLSIIELQLRLIVMVS